MMTDNKTIINKVVLNSLISGGFIPAHPLALNEDLTINEEIQRRLTRYYISCGVDGIAIGVSLMVDLRLLTLLRIKDM